MTPEALPNIRQLLAFYLEAGVDCALSDEPVNRLVEPEMTPVAAPVAREASAPQPVRGAPAIIPPRGEPPPPP
ncbi:MAG: uracil-DNA glycosylase, partial [Bradyrhizobium sp.]